MHEVDFITILTASCCRCMLRGFRFHNCPYWVRPSITITNHNGKQSDLLFYSFIMLNPFYQPLSNTIILVFRLSFVQHLLLENNALFFALALYHSNPILDLTHNN